MKQLANSNPLASKTLSKDLIGYWCVYQRADAQRRSATACASRATSSSTASTCEEGTPLLDRWRGWLANGGEALPRSFKPIPGMVDMGPLFSPRDHTYLLVNGSASRLSFGGTALFSLAVQFCPQPTPRAASGGPPAAAAGRAARRGRRCVLLSKFQTGLRGEFRLGLDEQLRPLLPSRGASRGSSSRRAR